MRPQIVCHMMSSIDGRLIGERWSPHFSGKTLALSDGIVWLYYKLHRPA